MTAAVIASEVQMPRLSDSMEVGRVIAWLKRQGDVVSVGDDLVEIETDKATVTYEADVGGTLAEIVAGEGEDVPVGAVIARILPEGDAPTRPGERMPATGADPVRASPIARRLAADLGIDLSQIAGSGPDGRIVKADVEAATASTSAPELSAPPQPASPTGPLPARAGPPPASGPPSTQSAVEDSDSDGVASSAKGRTQTITLTSLQQTVSRRMAESKATAPHFYLEAEIDMTAAFQARHRLKQSEDANLAIPSLNDMVVKACALALRAHPRVNGAYRDGSVELYERINIGVAVAAEDALVVPVIGDADTKGLAQIGTESRALAARVRDGSVAPRDLSGATFTVSNLGMFGISKFAAIVNPPQAAILAVGAVRETPVVRQHALAVGHTMAVTLACDHRILYGAHGAGFLAHVKALLEQPLSLAL